MRKYNYWEADTDINLFLANAPTPAIDARKDGWTKIAWFPKGYAVFSCDESCTIKYGHGWYGLKPGVVGSTGVWTWICGTLGETVPQETPTEIRYLIRQ